MNQTVVLGVVGVAIAGLLGYHGLYARQQGQARVIETRIAKEQADQQAQADAAALLQQVESYRKRLPPAPDTSWLAREVAALGKQVDVQLSAITQDPPQEGPSYTRLSVTLQFVASYHQVGTFVDALERSDTFIHVDQLEINRPTEEGKLSAVRLVVSTLYVKPLLKTAVAHY